VLCWQLLRKIIGKIYFAYKHITFCQITLAVVRSVLSVGRSFYVAGDSVIDVEVSLRGWSSMLFQVKGAANAYIALTSQQHNFTDGLMYEIALGVAGSGRTLIR